MKITNIITFDKDADRLCYNDGNHQLIFESYDDSGWKNSCWIEIPGSNFAFKIKSKFGHATTKCLECVMKYNGQWLVQSENWCETNKSLIVWEVQPTPYYWEDMLKHICDVYNKRNAWNSDNIVIAARTLNMYLAAPESLKTQKHYWSNKIINISLQSKNIHLIDKCNELMTMIRALNLEGYEILKQMIEEICCKALCVMFDTYNSVVNTSTCTSDLKCLYLKKITKGFDTIYNFLRDTNRLHLLFLNKHLTAIRNTDRLLSEDL